MASLAFSFFRSSRPAPVQPPELVAADAAMLRDMSREIPRKWQMLDAYELGDLIALLEPAVEMLSRADRLSQDDRNLVHSLLEQVTALRMRMLAALPAAEA